MKRYLMLILASILTISILFVGCSNIATPPEPTAVDKQRIAELEEQVATLTEKVDRLSLVTDVLLDEITIRIKDEERLPSIVADAWGRGLRGGDYLLTEEEQQQLTSQGYSAKQIAKWQLLLELDSTHNNRIIGNSIIDSLEIVTNLLAPGFWGD